MRHKGESDTNWQRKMQETQCSGQSDAEQPTDTQIIKTETKPQKYTMSTKHLITTLMCK